MKNPKGAEGKSLIQAAFFAARKLRKSFDTKRIVRIILIVLTVFLSWQIYFGKAGVFDKRQAEATIYSIRFEILDLTQKNNFLKAQLANVRQSSGSELIEGLARSNLDMVRPSELFILYDAENR